MPMAHRVDLEQQNQERRGGHHHNRNTNTRTDDEGRAGSSSSATTCNNLIRGVAATLESLVPSSCFSRCRSSGPPTPLAARVHHVWPGKNVFFFDGRVICGPDPRGLILTAMAVFLSEWMFLAYVIDWKWTLPSLIAWASLILAATVTGTLLRTAMSDPGIIPRNQVSEVDQEAAGASAAARSSTPSRFAVVNGVEMRLRFCRVCKIFRPPRSSHCAVCDNCVERFDHHCTWLSQCIGLRNYRLYVLLICSATAFYAFIFPFTVRRIRAELGAVTREGLGVITVQPFALAALSIALICFVVYLLAFNAFLVAKNKTRHEEHKGRHRGSPNPYDEGVLRNIKECLFQKLPPPGVDFRAVAGSDQTRNNDG